MSHLLALIHAPLHRPSSRNPSCTWTQLHLRPTETFLRRSTETSDYSSRFWWKVFTDLQSCPSSAWIFKEKKKNRPRPHLVLLLFPFRVFCWSLIVAHLYSLFFPGWVIKQTPMFTLLNDVIPALVPLIRWALTRSRLSICSSIFSTRQLQNAPLCEIKPCKLCKPIKAGKR